MPESNISPLATAIHQLVQWVGNGRTLTTTGELRVADGLELVQLLDTGDHPCGSDHQRRLSSSRNLPVLQSLLRLAVAAGMLRTQRGRLIQVKKHAQRAATAEGVRQILVENAHRTAPAELTPDGDRPELGAAVLGTLWTELSRNPETPLVVSELTRTLWNMAAPDARAIEPAPTSSERDIARAEFAESVLWKLLDYSELGLMALDAEQTLVQLTPTGRHETSGRPDSICPPRGVESLSGSVPLRAEDR